jgi:hypothetical protein
LLLAFPAQEWPDGRVFTLACMVCTRAVLHKGPNLSKHAADNQLPAAARFSMHNLVIKKCMRQKLFKLKKTGNYFNTHYYFISKLYPSLNLLIISAAFSIN